VLSSQMLWKKWIQTHDWWFYTPENKTAKSSRNKRVKLDYHQLFIDNVVSEDGWRRGTPSSITKCEDAHDLQILNININSTYFATTAWDRRVRIWCSDTMQHVQTLKSDGLQLSLQLSPSSDIIACGGLFGVSLWSVKTGEPLKVMDDRNPCYSIQLVDNMLLSASGYTVKLWDMETGENTVTLEGHPNAIEALHLVDNLLVSGCSENIKIWDVRAYQPVHTISKHVHLNSLQFDGSNTIYVSNSYRTRRMGAWVSNIKALDMRTGTKLVKYQCDSNTRICLEGDKLVGVSGSSCLALIWDIRDKKSTEPVSAIKISEEQGFVFAVGTQGSKLICPFNKDVYCFNFLL